jgi:type IV pilus assembly protein PilC
MPTYVYEALNEAGQPQKGRVTANNSEDAIAKIRSRGFFPSSVREQKSKKSSRPTPATPTGDAPTKKKWNEITITIGGVSTKALTTFTRQLSTLQDAGLPILRSLSVLEQQQKPGLLKNVLRGVHEDVSGGSTLSDAMANHPKVFNKLYSKMIAAGEVGGVLDLILQRLADFLEKAATLKRRIIGAMIYPSVVLSVAVLIVMGIMMFIVPKFEAIFKDFDTELPKLTRFLINSSQWIGGRLYPDQMIPGFVILLGVPFGFYASIKLLRKTQPGRAALDALALKIPIAGGLISKSTIARFTRTLGTLITAGVPILDAILITRDTTGNYVYQQALDKVHDSVRQGESFAEPLRISKACDAIVVNMIDVGEHTGDLDKMLLKIADNYDDQVDVTIAGMLSLLEPVMVVLLGGIIGFIVIALFMPLVSLIQNAM